MPLEVWALGDQKQFIIMKTVNSNLELARLENPGFFHVVNSNEVHSYENLEAAEDDLKEAIDNELKFNTGFKPTIEK